MNQAELPELKAHRSNTLLPPKRSVAFISGAPRVSTKALAEAGGARQHVLGTIDGFRANGWQVVTYIVGDKVPDQWLLRGRETGLAGSFLQRLIADFARLGLAAFHTLWSLRELPKTDWVYERCAAFQLFGLVFKNRSSLWILETNYLMYEELARDRKSVALGFVVRWMEQLAYRKCDILVTVSASLKQAIVAKLSISPDKILIIPNAADVDLFDPSRFSARRLFGQETFIIGFQGSMYKWAGLEYLVRLIQQLRSRGLDVCAVLVGDGHERAALEALVIELGVEDFVRFVGFVPRQDVPAYIAGFDLCFSGQVNLKSNEMYLSPLKLYDYMAMGKPVLASRFADAVELTMRGTLGYLFDPENFDDLLEVAQRAHNERSIFRALSTRIREEITTNHTWQTRIRDLIAKAQIISKRAQVAAKPRVRNSTDSGYLPNESNAFGSENGS